MTLILEVNDLIAGYGQRVLIRNLFFTLAEPAFVAVIGHNGAGKTTFFRAFTGQIPYSGQIRIGGRELSSITNPGATGLYSYLPQRNTVTFPVKVRELVVMGRFRHKRFLESYNDSDYAAAEQVLHDLQIAHLAEREFTELSGGEQQMVWLAQLTLQDAGVCLLDEPTQQLDVYHKKKVFALLNEWATVRQKTVLCITHDLQNLYPLQGYLLNLSKPNPQLEPISATSIQENYSYLEEAFLINN